MVQVHLPPDFYSHVAQLVERPAVNREVKGSSPFVRAYAGMAELEDVLDLGSSAYGVRVRPPLPVLCAISSAGRALALQARCRRFKSCIAHFSFCRNSLMDRALGYGPRFVWVRLPLSVLFGGTYG